MFTITKRPSRSWKNLALNILQSPKPLAALGDLDIELQTYDAAIAHLRAALIFAPADVESRIRLAVAYEAKGDSDDALAQIAKILARDSRNALAILHAREDLF